MDRRYRLGLRSGWWEDDIQIEILAALGAWVAMFDYANWTDPEGKARLILQLPSVRELLRGGANGSTPTATDRCSSGTSATSSAASRQTMFPDRDFSDDGTSQQHARPLELDETIRAVICTSDTPEDLARRVQQAIGEYASASDDLHVSHAVAPDPRSGLMLYTALIVLRPGLGNG